METKTTAVGIEFVRTPEDRFYAVEDFDYTPNYVEVEGLRMAYLDEGAGTSGHTILLPHPTVSPHQTFASGGHSIQDDHGPELADAINQRLGA